MRDNARQLTARPEDERAELLRALGGQLAERHKAMENYILGWCTTFRLLRRLGIDPLSWRGHLATGLLLIMFLLGLPLIITAVAGQWTVAEIQRWAIVAVTFGMAGATVYQPFCDVIDDLVSLHRTMTDESGLRRLIAWEHRWYNVRASTPVGAAFVVVTLMLLFSVQQSTFIAPLSAGSIVVGAVLLYQVGEMNYALFMLGVESRILAAYKYDLYHLSPIDSVAVQRSIRGYNGQALLNSLVMTIFIIEFAILLPGPSTLIPQIALFLLIITYLAIGFGVLLPRLAMRRIIRDQKEREMAPLQRRLNHLSARVRKLTEEEYEEMKRLEETHDKIRSSSENVLPLRSIAQIVGGLLLPTITFVATVTSEFYLKRLLQTLFP